METTNATGSTEVGTAGPLDHADRIDRSMDSVPSGARGRPVDRWDAFSRLSMDAVRIQTFSRSPSPDPVSREWARMAPEMDPADAPTIVSTTTRPRDSRTAESSAVSTPASYARSDTAPGTTTASRSRGATDPW